MDKDIFSKRLYERMTMSAENENSLWYGYTFCEEWGSLGKFYGWVLDAMPERARWLDYSGCEGSGVFSPENCIWVDSLPSVKKIPYNSCVYNAKQFSLEFDIPYDLVNICTKYLIPAEQMIQLKVSKPIKILKDNCVVDDKKKGFIKIEKAKMVDKPEWYFGDDKSWRSLFGRYKSFRKYMGRSDEVIRWINFESFAEWACESGYPEGRFFRKVDKSGKFIPDNVKFYKDRK